MPIEHVGLHADRLNHPASIMERLYADRWQKENDPSAITGGHLLQVLLAANTHPTAMFGGRPIYVVNQRDAHVAATVVQWLGTNIGRDFVWRVRQEFDEVKAHAD